MLRATVEYTRVAAIVELNDAQGWKTVNDTPRFRAILDYIKPFAVDVYTLIVDTIDVSDTVSNTDEVIFQFDKVINDEVISSEEIVFDVAKPLSDSQPVNDTVVFHTTKPFSDTTGTSDSAVYQMDKSITDTAGASDVAVFNMITPGDGGLADYAINETAINTNVNVIKVF